MVEYRNGVAREDHRHRYRDSNPKAAFTFCGVFIDVQSGVGFGAHLVFPLYVLPALPGFQSYSRDRANSAFYRISAVFMENSPLGDGKYCHRVAKYANV